MQQGQVYLQPAYILQHRPYRETSLLLDVFTRDYGLLTILAKGVRKPKSKLAGLLLPFTQIQISYLDKNELKLLSGADYVAGQALQGMALFCGFYVNELVQRFLHKHDPNPVLFQRYQLCLQQLLETDRFEQTLRYFELDLLTEAGYGVELTHTAQGQAILENQHYAYLANTGLIAQQQGAVQGRTLLALAKRAVLDDLALGQAKNLLRSILAEHLQGKPLKSRQVLAQVIQFL